MIADNKSTASLGHRIDSLRLALRTLGTDPSTEDSVRRMAATLRGNAEQDGAQAIADLARAAETAPATKLAQSLQDLIAALRAELAASHDVALTVLLVSADTPLTAALIGTLSTAGHKVLACDSSRTARKLIREDNPDIMIIDTVLPSDDGRILIHDLRCSSETAAMPIIAITPAKSSDESRSSLVNEADAYFRKPVEAAAIAEFLTARFRRGHDQAHAARRDPLSGLLNRAAFTESIGTLQAMCRTHGEPLSLALIGITDGDRLDRELSQEARDDLLRKIASTLSLSLRSTDVVARWSLYEFAVAFPGEDHFGMSCALEKVLSRIHGFSISTPDGRACSVKACAGCTVVAPEESTADCVARAEGFLFQARRTPPNSAVLTLVSDSLPSSERTARIALFVCDPTMEKAVAQMIENDRIETVPLRNTDSAIEQLSRGGFHMLIADDNVAGDASMTLIQAVRQSPSLNRLHIVLLAGSEESVTRGLDLGASDYIVKPVAAASFADRIRRNLSRRMHEGSTHPFTVMVVDTSVPQLVIAGTSLYRQSTCNVILAHGFQDAITRFRESSPDCMVINFDIPAVALSDFLERLSRLPGFANTQIIAACARHELPPGIACDPKRIAGFIEHPYKPATFLSQLEAHVTLPRRKRSTDVQRFPIENEIQRVFARCR